MKKILLMLLGVLITFPVLADDLEYTYKGQTLKYTILSEENKTCEVSENNRYFFDFVLGGIELSIPEKAVLNGKEYTVTSIGENAFDHTHGLTFVEIPNSVTSIKDEAFYSCYDLNSVKIGTSLTSIGAHAFYWCDNLISISIPGSVISIGDDAFYSKGLTKAEFASLEALCKIKFDGFYANPLYNAHNLWIAGEEVKDLVIPNSVTSIGNYAFSGCSEITTVEIPNSVTSIGEYAFSDCSALTSLEIPNSVTSIGEYAFSGCSGFTSIEIPNSLTSISNYAFYHCNGLTSIVIPNSVTSIGLGAFMGCRGLTSVHIPNSVTSIEEYAFDNCSSLTSIDIPTSLTSIGERGFSYCEGLTSIQIPNSITSIGEEAFYGCSGLTSLELGTSLNSIDHGAFGECYAIREINSLSTTPPMIYEDSFAEELYSAASLRVPASSINDYKDHWLWNRFRISALPVLVESITLNPLSWEGSKGISFKIIADVYPTDASNQQLEWSSSDESVAAVDAEGNVSALGEGTCEITAKATDGSGVSAVCTVNVKANSGVDETILDNGEAMMKVYTLDGILVMETEYKARLNELAPGVYIVRHDNKVKKIAVK